MKKLLVALLSLGLIVAFAMTASAQPTVKFSGQYYVNGVYEDNRGLGDPSSSKAFYWTRTRVQMLFEIAKGLTFTTRFDALERQWGSVNRSSNTTEDKSNSGKINSTNVTLQENIEMEHGYVRFATQVGQFTVGYMAANEWGTVFGDTPGSRPAASLAIPVGALTLILKLEKGYEADTVKYTGTPSWLTDADGDFYYLGGIFNFKGGSVGLMNAYANLKGNRPAAHFGTEIYTHLPYIKATFGPVYIESELIYQWGKVRKYDSGKGTDIDKDGLAFYILAKANLGPAYVGGQFGYSAGDDGTNATKNKLGKDSSTSWVPALIFGNANLTSWQYGATLGSRSAASTNTVNNKQNLILYNIFGGMKVTPKFNIEGAFSFMQADKTPAGYVSKDYGYEVDVKATYKIYDNLTYMVGAGYLFTGDYFKGTSSSNKIGNDYLVMNQLTLNF